jgi:Flp pilus assembly protein TadD
MRIVTAAAVLALLLPVAACGGEATIDASSEEAFSKSTEELMNSLPTEQEKEEFARAIQTLAMEAVLSEGGVEDIQKNGMELLHGKTVDEVLAAAREAQTRNQAELQKLLQDG